MTLFLIEGVLIRTTKQEIYPHLVDVWSVPKFATSNGRQTVASAKSMVSKIEVILVAKFGKKKVDDV
jgi:hypothetical protein